MAATDRASRSSPAPRPPRARRARPRRAARARRARVGRAPQAHDRARRGRARPRRGGRAEPRRDARALRAGGDDLDRGVCEERGLGRPQPFKRMGGRSAAAAAPPRGLGRGRRRRRARARRRLFRGGRRAGQDRAAPPTRRARARGARARAASRLSARPLALPRVAHRFKRHLVAALGEHAYVYVVPPARRPARTTATSRRRAGGGAHDGRRGRRGRGRLRQARGARDVRRRGGGVLFLETAASLSGAERRERVEPRGAAGASSRPPRRCPCRAALEQDAPLYFTASSSPTPTRSGRRTPADRPREARRRRRAARHPQGLPVLHGRVGRRRLRARDRGQGQVRRRGLWARRDRRRCLGAAAAGASRARGARRLSAAPSARPRSSSSRSASTTGRPSSTGGSTWADGARGGLQREGAGACDGGNCAE